MRICRVLRTLAEPPAVPHTLGYRVGAGLALPDKEGAASGAPTGHPQFPRQRVIPLDFPVGLKIALREREEHPNSPGPSKRNVIWKDEESRLDTTHSSIMGGTLSEPPAGPPYVGHRVGAGLALPDKEGRSPSMINAIWRDAPTGHPHPSAEGPAGYQSYRRGH